VTGPLKIADVAERAGVPEEFVWRLADAGAFERGTDELDEGSIRRAMLLRVCADAGLPIEAIGAAIASGHLTLQALDRPYYRRWGQRLDMTWDQLSAQAGVPLEVVQQMYASLGFAPPEADDHPRVDEPDFLTAAAVSFGAGIDAEAILRALRVYGESFRRITRTETALWHDYIDVPAERAGASQRDILAMGSDFGEAIMSIIDASTLAVYHRWQEHAWMGDLVEHIELALVEAGVYDKPDRPSTMAFMDLSGYTALTEEHGDEAAAELATALAAIVQRTAQQHAGEAMKFLGDGVMFRFRDPASAVRGALEVVGATVPAGLPPAHVGMHTGAVIERDGDVFGRTVNLASRISGKAGPGEVLVTREIVEAADDAALAFEPLGPVELKGVADPVALFRAAPA
jgi:class 3 adenylate cyclase